MYARSNDTYCVCRKYSGKKNPEMPFQSTLSCPCDWIMRRKTLKKWKVGLFVFGANWRSQKEDRKEETVISVVFQRPIQNSAWQEESLSSPKAGPAMLRPKETGEYRWIGPLVQRKTTWCKKTREIQGFSDTGSSIQDETAWTSGLTPGKEAYLYTHQKIIVGPCDIRRPHQKLKMWR